MTLGTELKVYRGDFASDEQTDLTIKGMEDVMTYPLRYGYSSVGRIVVVAGEESSSSSSLIGKRVFSFSPHGSHHVLDINDLIFVPDDVASGITFCIIIFIIITIIIIIIIIIKIITIM